MWNLRKIPEIILYNSYVGDSYQQLHDSSSTHSLEQPRSSNQNRNFGFITAMVRTRSQAKSSLVAGSHESTVSLKKQDINSSPADASPPMKMRGGDKESTKSKQKMKKKNASAKKDASPKSQEASKPTKTKRSRQPSHANATSQPSSSKRAKTAESHAKEEENAFTDIETKKIEALNQIRKEAEPFLVEIENFEELEKSNKYYYIEESLRRFIEKLDDLFDDIEDNEMLRIKRREVYKFIFPIFDKLDVKTAENRKKIEAATNQC